MRREGDVIKIEELRHKRAQISRKGANVYLLPPTIVLKIIFFCDFKNLTCRIVRRSIEYFNTFAKDCWREKFVQIQIKAELAMAVVASVMMMTLCQLCG